MPQIAKNEKFLMNDGRPPMKGAMDDGRPFASLTRTMDAKAFSSLVPRLSSLVVLVAVLLLLAFTAACSKPNPKAPFNPESQKHEADWLPHRHMEAAQANVTSCKECHGNDLLGGITRVSCTTCHLGGVESMHPADWAGEQIWSKHKAFVAGIGTAACSNAACHGADLEGVDHAPACASCHLDGVSSKHLQAWGANAAFLHGDDTIASGAAKCANAACHAQGLGGVAGSGPACSTCHPAPAHGVQSPYSAACSSCHPANGRATSEMFHRWAAPTTLNHAAYVTTNTNASCAIAACHGTSLTGGANANCPSCTSCHLGGVASKHPTEWGAAIIQVHQTYVAANSTASCANAACHGPNLTGGTASAPSCTTCHIGGVITISKHPFAAPAVTNHKAYVVINGTASCALAACHGPGLTGAGNAPSCVTACHLGDAATKHPASFGTTTTQVALQHKAYVDTNGSTGCATNYCHGSSLNGASPAIGPSCSTTACHQIGIPTGASAANCISCHVKPPAGAAAPNREGAHVEHNALAGVTNVCDTCHAAAGTGTTNHFNSTVNVQFAASFNAKSGAAAHTPDANGGTCSNISCHGGQTTPAWRTGAIDVSTQCTSCHAFGTAEYNSYSSGRHSTHVGYTGGCSACHIAAQLPASGHFGSLDTSAIDRSVAITSLNSGLTYTGYNITGGTYGTCTPLCHGNRPW